MMEEEIWEDFIVYDIGTVCV